MAEIDNDPEHMREVARRFREIALDHEREGSQQVAKKMRRAAVDIEPLRTPLSGGIRPKHDRAPCTHAWRRSMNGHLLRRAGPPDIQIPSRVNKRFNVLIAHRCDVQIRHRTQREDLATSPIGWG